MEKKTVFSAIQPTGGLTIGNYIGAIKNMIKLQEEYKCFYSVADLHTLTIDVPPIELRENCYKLYAMLLAFGINNSTLFVQSHVPAHSQLTWVLNCYTQVGEAKRMTQFKDKSAKHPKNINVGLFDYPVLMAADILLYGTHLVPIGHDQKQHLELARVIAERFNGRCGKTFEVPDGFYPKYGAKIYSLLDPQKKMSKTEEANGTIYIDDSDDDIIKKFKRAVTDSETEIRYDKAAKPGISNLLTIYSSFTNKTIPACEKEFQSLRYSDLKLRTAEAVIEGLREVKIEYNKLYSDKAYLNSVMKTNAQTASVAASATLNNVYRKIGLVD